MLNSVTKTALDRLAERVPADTLKPATDAYLTEERGRWRGQGAAVAAPRDTETVAEIVRWANEARVPILPYGGGTGLVAGSVKPEGEVPLILSLERMTAIRETHGQENVLIAEAGATLLEIQSAALTADCLFPLSYGSEGTARIGGALAVNSGGLNVVRYGTARDLCLGLEAVLPNGDIWHGLKRLRKDNTGYDLKNLLIGAEGTLGVITAASLRLHARPAHTATAFLTVRDPDAALELFHRMSTEVGTALSAFELISGTGLQFIRETDGVARIPFDPIPAWMVLMELGAPRAMDADQALETLLEKTMADELVLDGLIAQSDTQRQAFWTVREAIPLANKALGAVASNDISLPLSEVAGFIRSTEAAISKLGPLRVNAFGHLGDGNLHFNVFPEAGIPRETLEHLRAPVTDLVHDFVHRAGGSFSAEHGIGRMKVKTLEEFGDPARLAAMRAIKCALDPNGIMNPGAVLRLNAD